MAFQMYHIQTRVAFFRQPAGRVPPWLRQLDNAYQHGCCAVILLVPFEFTSMNCHTELGHGHPFGALSSSSHILMRIRFALSVEVPHPAAAQPGKSLILMNAGSGEVQVTGTTVFSLTGRGASGNIDGIYSNEALCLDAAHLALLSLFTWGDLRYLCRT